MRRQCPHCGSLNVRRSGRLESESGTHPFHSPYRCRDCEQRFWVVSRKTLFGAAAGGTVLAVALILSGIVLLSRHDSAPSIPVGSAADWQLNSPAQLANSTGQLTTSAGQLANSAGQLAPSPEARILGETVLKWGSGADGSRQTEPSADAAAPGQPPP